MVFFFGGFHVLMKGNVYQLHAYKTRTKKDMEMHSVGKWNVPGQGEPNSQGNSRHTLKQ